MAHFWEAQSISRTLRDRRAVPDRRGARTSFVTSFTHPTTSTPKPSARALLLAMPPKKKKKKKKKKTAPKFTSKMTKGNKTKTQKVSSITPRGASQTRH